MDILISSNLERLLYILTDGNDAKIKEWFGALASCGKYEVDDDVKALITESFAAGFCDDIGTKEAIKSVYDKYSYTMDTHTAVAYKVYEEYKAKTGDETKTVIASTASPYKFSASVLEAIDTNAVSEDEYAMVDKLCELSKYEIPKSLAELKNKAVRFDKVIAKDDMKEYVLGEIIK